MREKLIEILKTIDRDKAKEIWDIYVFMDDAVNTFHRLSDTRELDKKYQEQESKLFKYMISSADYKIKYEKLEKENKQLKSNL